MWDLFTKVLLKLHGEMGMPGRKGEKDQYSFFFFLPPPCCNREGMLVMKPLASVVRIMIAYHCDMLALLKVILSSRQSSKCLMNFCLELDLDLACSLQLSLCVCVFII